jgi:hypothetical protein
MGSMNNIYFEKGDEKVYSAPETLSIFLYIAGIFCFTGTLMYGI